MAPLSIKPLSSFLKGEDGQDLIEYTLLIAFICLASALLISGSGITSTSTIWRAVNNNLSSAQSAAS
jgi:Flp pilus assembly pilin Flp